jgi:hypothetical protein
MAGLFSCKATPIDWEGDVERAFVRSTRTQTSLKSRLAAWTLVNLDDARAKSEEGTSNVELPQNGSRTDSKICFHFVKIGMLLCTYVSY